MQNTNSNSPDRGRSDAADGGGEEIPELTNAAARAATLLNVGAAVDVRIQEQAIHALASTRREHGESLLTALALAILQHASQSQAQLFQDVFALFVAKFRKGGFFVEVGTGDGKLISNTYLLEKTWGWNGIVIEPNATFWPVLKQHRSCRIATDCVFDVTGRTVQFMCAESPEFSGINHPGADLHEDARNQNPVEVTMSTISLNDLLAREGAPDTIDYLSIDVEGAEFDILQTFDLDKYKVDCLTIEHNWTPNRDSVYNLLTARNYVRVFEHLSQWDDWYVRRDVLEQFPAAADLLKANEDAAVVEPSAEHLVAWSLEAISRGEFEVAETLCRRALELDATWSAAYRTLADVAIGQGRRTLALQHWRSAVAADPSDFWARFGLAEMLASRGALWEAVSHLREALALDGDVSRANELLAELLPKAAGQVNLPTER